MKNLSIATEPFPTLTVQEFYEDSELELINEELQFLSSKIDKQLVLDTVYSDRSYSNILNVNRKIYDSGLTKTYADCDFSCKMLGYVNFDGTKIHKLSKQNEVTYGVEPFQFVSYTMLTTAEIWFPEYELKLDLPSNSTIIFPSYVIHGICNADGYAIAQLFTTKVDG